MMCPADLLQYHTYSSADTPSEYYCRTLSIRLLDYLLCEMKTRFSSHQQTALLGLSVVPSIMVALPSDEYFSKVGELANYI